MADHFKLLKLSSAMSLFCSLLIIAIPAQVLWFWANISSNLSQLSIARDSVLLDMQYIQFYQIAIAGGFSLLVALILVYGLIRLRALFAFFKRGILFSLEAANHLLIFAQAVFITALLTPLRSAITSMSLTMNNPEGKKVLIIEFGSNELAMILAAGTLLAIAWVLRESHTIAKENEAFV